MEGGRLARVTYLKGAVQLSCVCPPIQVTHLIYRFFSYLCKTHQDLPEPQQQPGDDICGSPATIRRVEAGARGTKSG
eukprot:3512429-Rhodomonas_salina.3